MTVERFCARLGIPRSNWYYWRTAHLKGRETRRWPAPVVDALEEPAAAKAYEFSAWGHRKIWAMLRADGADVSQSSVRRALARRGLLLPVRYQAERRTLAKARRATFVAPPRRRNRVWQTDFSHFETLAGGTWIISAVVDYGAKHCLAAVVSGTQAADDAIETIRAAITEAEDLLDGPLKDDLVDPDTGEIAAVTLVTDNGPAYKSAAFARFIAANPELAHVRTRHRAPETNGVVERFFGSLKYEHLYRHEIEDGVTLTDHIDAFRQLYNHTRPHEALDFNTPAATYLRDPQPPDVDVTEPNQKSGESVQKTGASD